MKTWMIFAFGFLFGMLFIFAAHAEATANMKARIDIRTDPAVLGMTEYEVTHDPLDFTQSEKWQTLRCCNWMGYERKEAPPECFEEAMVIRLFETPACEILGSAQ